MNNFYSETLPAITWAVIIGVALYTLVFGRQRKEKEVVDDTTKVSRRGYVEEKDRNINERNREREEKEEEDQLGDDQFIDD